MATVLPKREFIATTAKREKVPLLVGLMGPSGGGKTFTALRLATGIQSVVGGDIYFIDTESRRALHYADKFKFKHVPFDAPFGSLDYLAALQWCVKQGAGVVIVDSMSHEHEGPGGMIDLQDQVLTRMTGGNENKRHQMQMLAWAEPKAKRRALINGILQLNSNFIFCFRAKNTSKPVKRDGKNVVEQMGFMPIAGEEFVFEQTLNALLLPGAGGVPTWHSEQVGERTMIKLPEQFAALRQRNTPLDEKVGERLAKWAAGEPSVAQEPAKTEPRQFEAVDAQRDEFDTDTDEPDFNQEEFDRIDAWATAYIESLTAADSMPKVEAIRKRNAGKLQYAADNYPAIYARVTEADALSAIQPANPAGEPASTSSGEQAAPGQGDSE
jgi:ABC-type oligopeptide transport system ATPase subunit